MRLTRNHVATASIIIALTLVAPIAARQGGGAVITSGGPTSGGSTGGTYGSMISGTATPPAATPKGTGAISGVVTDASTGQPLSGAIVRVNAPTGATLSPLVGQHVTDSKGRFVFTDLGAASYTVAVRRSGYIDATYGDT